MNILIYIHAAPPLHFAGAETMVWEFAQEMIRRGHKVRCISKGAKEGEYEGVKTLPHAGFIKPDGRLKVQRDVYFKWADIVWTHLGFAGEAKRLCQVFKKPLIHVIHNSAKITPALNGRVNQGFIFNSETMLKAHSRYKYLNTPNMPRPYTVVRPTIDPSKYKTTQKGDHYTLINVNENKGGWQFYNLAKKMRGGKFLGVQGMYGRQVFRQDEVLTDYLELKGEEYTPKKLPKNLTYQPNTGDMISVYNRTRILLIMSSLETWGRTASEAMSNGIPVIYHHPKDGSPTDGVHEHVGSGGYRVYNREDLDEWRAAIKAVEADYDGYSKKALNRYQELGNDFDNLERINQYMVNWSARTRTVRL